MPYQSPLHLLDSLQIEPSQLNPAGLVQVRKKILAEFNLTPDITIAVGNKQYTKDEALKAIDQLKELQHLNDHAAIFQDKPLLAWLENPTGAEFPIQSISDQHWSGQQSPFFDEILADGLQAYCSYLLKRRQFSTIIDPLALAFSLPDPLPYTLQETIYEFIQDITAQLEEAQKVPNHRRDPTTFGYIVYDDWADFLNSLPKSAFWHVVNDYCVAAVNYTVAVQHYLRDFVYEITHQLVRTNCDSGLKTTIQSNYQIYRENYHHKPGATETKSRSYGWVIWLVVILIKLVIACSG
ncbi:hypothetical protein GCM10028808_34950 [Spirosoma migulaei]